VKTLNGFHFILVVMLKEFAFNQSNTNTSIYIQAMRLLTKNNKNGLMLCLKKPQDYPQAICFWNLGLWSWLHNPKFDGGGNLTVSVSRSLPQSPSSEFWFLAILHSVNQIFSSDLK